jgi:sugar porter (SP) family MFS transporter|uniref:Hexose transporter 1 n=1 Tax=Globisporangium ultimum (strain ATCC 200006 / CBS 805.95 / DAOM BR144) TaxID=431595 RepID=K3X774_GLOUD
MAGGVALNVHDRHAADDLPTEGTRTYAIIVCIFASLGGLFFGYDQGVTGGVLVMDSYLRDFCVGWHGQTYEECTAKSTALPDRWIDFTLWYNMTYNIGCIVGALIGGWVADKFGRRVTIFNAGLLFCLGTSWVCFSPDQAHASLLIARVIQGMGVGNSSFSLPIFGAEMAPKELRGFLSGFMQMTIVTGLLLANIVNLAVEDHAQGWRITNGVAMVAPIIVMLGIFFVPESPRWTYQHKGKDAAEAVLKKLRQTENVDRELTAIGDQIAEEGEPAGWTELLQPSILKRVLIAMALQVLQQATGINPMFSYGGLIFKDVVGDGIMSVLILSIVNFVSTIPAMRWVDTFGRRQLLLIGAVGMVLGHVLSGTTFTAGCDGNTDDSGCSKTAGYIIIVGTAFFIFNFAISWGPVCWIYPAEIFPMNVRAKAVSLSTMSNWVMGTCMTWVVKLFPSLNINGVFFLFCGTCAISGVFVYLLCPETKGLLLEDIESLFVKDGGKQTFGNVSSKYVEVQTPQVSSV